MAKLKATSITGDLTITGKATSTVAGATTSTPGTVQLNDTVTSTSATQAATAKAAKTAYDKGVEALDVANGKLGATANAVSASKLATARTIALGGDLSGSSTFDGTANITISAQIANDSHEHTQVIGKRSNIILKDFDNGNVTLSGSKAADGTVGDLYLGYNTSTYFTKNIRLESPVNWKGGSAYIIDTNGKIDWAVLKNVPTPLQFGALPLGGGTMTGGIRFNVSTDTDAIKISGSTRDSFIGKMTDQGGLGIASDSSMLLFAGDSYGLLKDGLGIVATTTTEQLILGADNSIRLVTNMQTDYATSKEYTFGTNGRLTVPNDVYVGANRVYHQGFNPTASQVGAAPTVHNHDDLYFRKGNWNTNGGQDLTVHGKRAVVGMASGSLYLSYGNDFSNIYFNNSTIWHSGNFDPNSKMASSPSSINMAKSGTISRINFAAQTNDPGFIEHYESANQSRLRFCVSDDSASGQDAFEFGSAPGGTWTPRFFIDADGQAKTAARGGGWWDIGGAWWSTSGPSGVAPLGAIWVQY